MTPEQIEFTRELLAALPDDERPILARAAAEYLRLHDAIQRLYNVSADDVQHEADSLGVCPATLAHSGADCAEVFAMTPYHESDGDTDELRIPPHLQVDPEKVSLPEVQAYLRDRGIDLTDALQRVRAAVAEARRRNREKGQRQ